MQNSIESEAVEKAEHPTAWASVRFEEIVENVTERVDPSETNLEVYVGLEHLTPETLKIKEWGSPADVIGQKLMFRAGDIIFGKRRAYQRKLAVAECDGICSAHAMVLRADTERIVPEFLPFFLQSDVFMKRAVDISVGSLSPTINWKTLRKQEFSLPSKTEQHRISEVLSAARSTVESHEQVVVDVTKSWQTLIDHVVPGPETHDRVVKLEEVCEMQNGRPFPSKHYREQGFKLLRPGNLAIGGNLDWCKDSTVYLDDEHVSGNPDHIVRAGDVVMNLTAQSLEDGFMGRVCLASQGDESLLNQRLGRFLCKPGVSSEYLFRVLQTRRFRRLVESRCEGSKVRHTYFRHFADLPLVILDDNDQTRVVERARQIDSARDSAILAKLKSQELLICLREKAMGGGA